MFDSSEVATPVATNAAAAPTDTTTNLQPATGGVEAMEITTIMRLGLIGVSSVFLMHLL